MDEVFYSIMKLSILKYNIWTVFFSLTNSMMNKSSRAIEGCGRKRGHDNPHID